MSIFLCQSNGDFAIVNNQLMLTDNSVTAATPSPGQETAQLSRNNLRMFLGEEPLDPTLGVPYFEQILQKETPFETSQAILEQAVRDTDGVLDVLNFTLSVDTATRKGTVSFTATTAAGPVTTTETFP
jgi:hypothetical protein